MIVTRTPFRVSFAGGGSDLADYYEKFGGAVVSTTINKYVYLSMHPCFFKDGYLLRYFKTERVSSVDEIGHPIIKEIFKLYGIGDVNLSSDADIPSGTGVGSSSAFTAGLIGLCNAWNGTYLGKEQIAAQACHVEIDLLKEPIGKQDQYACACGGLNFIEFKKNGQVSIEKLHLSQDTYEKMQGNLLMFYTGRSRKASDVLREQKRNTTNDPHKIEILHKMVQLARDFRSELLRNRVDSTGVILKMNWEFKKKLAGNISNSFIDGYYEKALKAGAMGGKLLGAGGGGFLLFYVPENNQAKVREALSALQELPFCFDYEGTKVIYCDGRRTRNA